MWRSKTTSLRMQHLWWRIVTQALLLSCWIAVSILSRESLAGITTCEMSVELSLATSPYIPEPTRAAIRRERRERVQSELTQFRFPRAKEIRYLGDGNDNVITLVRDVKGAEFVARVPYGEDVSRYHQNYASEKNRIEAAMKKDPKGSRYLAKVFHILEPTPDLLPVLCMGYAELGSLRDNLSLFGPANARDNPRRFVKAWKEMALGVRSLHWSGTVHRDIKPGNFLVYAVGQGYRLELTDFGIATGVGEQVHGREGLLSGTLSHMSRNQLERGHAIPTDDLFALKMTYKEMLIGKIVWHLDAGIPGNHIVLNNWDNFGTYPILTALPDFVAPVVPEGLRLLAEAPHANIEAVLEDLEKLE